MVYVDGTEGCRLRHLTKEAAIREAERLARLLNNIGKEVAVLEVVDVCHAEQIPVIWHTPEMIKEGA